MLGVVADLQAGEVDQLVEGWADQAQRLPVEQVGAWAQVGVVDPADAVGLQTHGVQPDEVHTYGLARQIANHQLPINEAARLLLRLRGPAGARQASDETAQREGLARARAQRDEYFRRHRQAGRCAAPPPPTPHGSAAS